MTDSTKNNGEIVTTITAIEAITRGEVDLQVATAKRYPRDIAVFRREAMNMATADQDAAASCFYKLPPRGDRVIEGPSVRFAEIVGQCWGNMRCESRPLSEDETTVLCQGQCWDLERNYAVRVESRRKITTKEGRRYSEDMIAVTSNAACAIAFRNAVFKAVPKTAWGPVYLAARKRAVGELGDLERNRDKWLAYFLKGGVSTQRVLAYLSKKSVAEIGIGDLETLQGILTALKEGSAQADDIFPPEQMAEGESPVRPPKQTKPRAKPKAQKQTPPAPPPDTIHDGILPEQGKVSPLADEWSDNEMLRLRYEEDEKW